MTACDECGCKLQADEIVYAHGMMLCADCDPDAGDDEEDDEEDDE
jgi:hypothetical protein